MPLHAGATILTAPLGGRVGVGGTVSTKAKTSEHSSAQLLS